MKVPLRAAGWLAVLVACEVLIQWHGWGYWRRVFDPRVGWAVPVVLAVLAAVLWWRAGRAAGARAVAWGAVAGLTSCVLLAGPLLLAGEPLLQQWRSAQERPARLAALEDDLRKARGDVTRYQALREAGVIGYYALLERASDRVERAEAERRLLLAQPGGPAWQAWAGGALLMAALLLLQAGAALAAVWCAQALPCEHLAGEPAPAAAPPASPMPARPAPRPAPAGEPEPAPPRQGGRFSPALATNDVQVKRLQHTIRRAAQRDGMTIAAWGRMQTPPIHKRDLSNLFAYFTHKTQGKTPEISRAKLTELAARYLPPDTASGG